MLEFLPVQEDGKFFFFTKIRMQSVANSCDFKKRFLSVNMQNAIETVSINKYKLINNNITQPFTL